MAQPSSWRGTSSPTQGQPSANHAGLWTQLLGQRDSSLLEHLVLGTGELWPTFCVLDKESGRLWSGTSLTTGERKCVIRPSLGSSPPNPLIPMGLWERLSLQALGTPAVHFSSWSYWSKPFLFSQLCITWTPVLLGFYLIPKSIYWASVKCQAQSWALETKHRHMELTAEEGLT